MPRDGSAPVLPRRSNHVDDPPKALRDVLGEEALGEMAVLLKQEVLATVASIVLRVGEVERSVDFDRNALLFSEKVRFHERIRAERHVDAMSPCYRHIARQSST